MQSGVLTLEQDERDLLAWRKSRDEAALESLLDRYQEMIWRASLRNCHGDARSAEEVAQAVALIFSQKAHTIRDPARLTSWFYQCQLNVIRQQHREKIRREKREKEYQENYFRERLGDEAETWQDLRPLLDQAVNQLSKAKREAVILHYLENKPIKEVAKILGANAGAIKKRLFESREDLRQFF